MFPQLACLKYIYSASDSHSLYWHDLKVGLFTWWYYSAQCFDVSVSFISLGILPESHYYPDLKHSFVPFSHKSSFLHFRIVSPNFMYYLLTPLLLMSVASARVVWLSVTPVTSTIGLLCELNYGQSLYNKTSKFTRNIYYNEGISVSKRFPLWEQKPGYLSEKYKYYKDNSRMHSNVLHVKKIIS